MLESLANVLKTYGLELIMKKTKILSTINPSDQDQVCITEHGPVDVLGTSTCHKYLGRKFIGDLKSRGKVAVDHRLSCAWMKYKAFRHALEDKHANIKLRLKLFDSIVSSTLLYGLEIPL